jgi:putative methyltransferase
MACVLCYELIFGEGVKPHGPAERAVLSAEGELRAAAEGLMTGAGVENLAELLGESPRVNWVGHPRTARVNLLRMTVKAAMSHLKDPKKPCWQEAFRVGLLSNVYFFNAIT